MSEMHYQQVTVAQVIERADIGRSTFYAHFETKDELLEDMCTEMFQHIFEGVNEFCVTHAELETSDLAGKLAHLLYHMRDSHSGVCGKLVREGEPHFTACFERHLETLFERELVGRDRNAGACGQAGLPCAAGSGQEDGAVAGTGPSLAAAAAGHDGGRSSSVEVPKSLAVAIAVAAFSRTVGWWFARGAADVPEDVAAWFVAAIGAEE